MNQCASVFSTTTRYGSFPECSLYLVRGPVYENQKLIVSVVSSSCCGCCCSHINSQYIAVRGNRTGSNKSGVEEIPQVKQRQKQKQTSLCISPSFYIYMFRMFTYNMMVVKQVSLLHRADRYGIFYNLQRLVVAVQNYRLLIVCTRFFCRIEKVKNKQSSPRYSKCRHLSGRGL